MTISTGPKLLNGSERIAVFAAQASSVECPLLAHADGFRPSEQSLENPAHRIIAFKDFVHGQEEAYDDHGRGTLLAAAVTECGASNDQVKVRLLPGNGSMAEIVNGLHWAQEHDYGIVSFSGLPESYFSDPVERAVKRAMEAGIAVVAGAGNLRQPTGE